MFNDLVLWSMKNEYVVNYQRNRDPNSQRNGNWSVVIQHSIVLKCVFLGPLELKSLGIVVYSHKGNETKANIVFIFLNN